MYGIPEMPIRNVTISNVDMDITGSEKGIYAVMAFDREASYGEGVFLENTENISMNNISIRCSGEKITLRNSKNIVFNGNELQSVIFREFSTHLQMTRL